MSGAGHRLLQDSIVRSARTHPDSTALGAQGARCTYEELLDRSLRFARGLQELGLRRGDRVAIVMPNSIPCVVSLFGTLLAGGVFVVVNADTKSDRLATILEHSQTSFVIGEGSLRDVLSSAVLQAPCVRDVLLSRAAADRGSALDLDDLIARSDPHPVDPGSTPFDLAALIYTSGTTGEPKGVMMTHQNLVYLAGSISEYLRLSRDDRIFSVLSLAHTYGLSQLIVSTRLGAALHLERSFVYLAQATKVIEAEAITVFPGVPTVFAMLLSIHRKSPLQLPSVQRVTCAGGALLPSFLDGLREIFPNALVFPMYGLTECMRVCFLEPELVMERPASVGRAIPGSEVMILSPEGTPVPPGESGILHVRGPHVMPGYWNDPVLTSEMLLEGPVPGARILRTGDHFRADDEGFLYFIGRSDEIIKTRGEKVSPVEIENVVHGIPGVREAAALGVPDELFGEAIRVYVAVEEGVALTERDIIAECRSRLEAFKIPKEVVFLDELPKTTTGKVRKASLTAG